MLFDILQRHDHQGVAGSSWCLLRTRHILGTYTKRYVTAHTFQKVFPSSHSVCIFYSRPTQPLGETASNVIIVPNFMEVCYVIRQLLECQSHDSDTAVSCSTCRQTGNVKWPVIVATVSVCSWCACNIIELYECKVSASPHFTVRWHNCPEVLHKPLRYFETAGSSYISVVWTVRSLETRPSGKSGGCVQPLQ
jgi:hypothetical protein